MKKLSRKGEFFCVLESGDWGTGSQVSGGDDVLCSVGQEEDDVGDDEDRHGGLQWEKGVDVIPKEHDADDKDDAGEHFRKKTCGFEDLAALFVFSHGKHEERVRMAQRMALAMPRERLLSMAERASFSVSLKSSA